MPYLSASAVVIHCGETLYQVYAPFTRSLTRSVVLLTDAVKNLVDFLGLQACERSDKVPEGKSAHTLYLAGVFRGGHDVLVRCKLAATADSGVTMQMTVRSTDASVSQVITAAIA